MATDEPRSGSESSDSFEGDRVDDAPEDPSAEIDDVQNDMSKTYYFEEERPSTAENKDSDIEPTCRICMESLSGDRTSQLVFEELLCSGKSNCVKCMRLHKTLCNVSIVGNLIGAENLDQIEDKKTAELCPSTPHLQFCFKCLSPAHSPCSCKMWELPKTEGNDQPAKATANCPKCQSPIERKGGCNHVTCPNCQQPFCWKCGQATEKHQSGTVMYKEKAEPSEQDLEHYYTHCREMYENHLKFFQLEKKFTEEMQNSFSSPDELPEWLTDPSWLTSALHSLSVARWVLVNSYPFAFYLMFAGTFPKLEAEKEWKFKLQLFQYQQQQLEASVWRLTGSLNAVKVLVDQNSDLANIKNSVFEWSAAVGASCKNMYYFVDKELLEPLPVGFKTSIGITKATPILIEDSSSPSSSSCN